MTANNIFLKSMSIKILIPAKIKLRGEEIGGAFRSIIYEKLKKKILIKRIIILGM